jgi:hypothetical protein
MHQLRFANRRELDAPGLASFKRARLVIWALRCFFSFWSLFNWNLLLRVSFLDLVLLRSCMMHMRM